MDSLGIVVAVIAAVLGSTGIAGLLSSGVLLTRSARLRHSIERSIELAEKVGDATSGGSALHWAAQVDSARLASLTLFPRDRRLRTLVPMLIVTLVVSTAWVLTTMEDPWSDPTDFDNVPPIGWIVVAAVVSYAVLIVVTLDLVAQRRRDAVVKAILAGADTEQYMAKYFNTTTSPRPTK